MLWQQASVGSVLSERLAEKAPQWNRSSEQKMSSGRWVRQPRDLGFHRGRRSGVGSDRRDKDTASGVEGLTSRTVRAGKRNNSTRFVMLDMGNATIPDNVPLARNPEPPDRPPRPCSICSMFHV